MANVKHLKILEQGVSAWNAWRTQQSDRHPNLRGANLAERLLPAIDFRGVDLSQADLHGADLTDANLDGAKLSEARLLGADLVKVHGHHAKFGHADLSTADLRQADLFGTDFYQADLTHACLADTDLREANIFEANLTGVNLTGANLRYARITHVNLRDADLSNSAVFGIAAWDLDLTGAQQTNLIITPPNAPVITTDNLKIAQFIYLILNNANLREVIDTVARKAVLILGRFTPERKKILDLIREELRRRDYLPILFDFDRPQTKDIDETVRTLAHLSCFIIADLTEPSSIPFELGSFVPFVAVPVQPILLTQQHEFSMFGTMPRKYDWVLPIHSYQDATDLLQSFDAKIVQPAQAKAAELIRAKTPTSLT